MQFFFIFGAMFFLLCLLALSIKIVNWAEDIPNQTIGTGLQLAIASFWIALLFMPTIR